MSGHAEIWARASSAALLLLAAGCGALADPLIKEAQERVRRDLKDPDSAQFREVARCEKPNAVRGEYNAKNSYGAYVGFKPFIYADGKLWTSGGDSIYSYDDISGLCYSDAIIANVAAEMNAMGVSGSDSMVTNIDATAPVASLTPEPSARAADEPMDDLGADEPPDDNGEIGRANFEGE